jgi:bifunctional DNA-binding transcriptional regulator/antitoxin component of YhaV-PrlF toxin-antitoxin module
MKDSDTMTVSKVGQNTLPKWWRDASGLSRSGAVAVHPMGDAANSIILTPKRARRRGVSGKDLLKQFSRCPWPLPPPERHPLPFK